MTLRKITNLIYDKLSRKSKHRGQSKDYRIDDLEVRMGTAKIKIEQKEEQTLHVQGDDDFVKRDSVSMDEDRSDIDDSSSSSCFSRDPNYILEDDGMIILP